MCCKEAREIAQSKRFNLYQNNSKCTITTFSPVEANFISQSKKEAAKGVGEDSTRIGTPQTMADKIALTAEDLAIVETDPHS